jgi:hypothetical protein
MRVVLVAGVAMTALVVACSGGSSSSGSASSSSSSSSSSTGGGGGSSSTGGASSTPASSGGSCYLITEGASSGGSSGVANWACLDRPCWASPGAATTFTQNLTIKNISTQAVLPGATVKVCAQADVACASPSQTLTTPANGLVVLDLPITPGVGFDGLIEVTGAGAVPTLYKAHPPLVPGGVDRNLFVFNQSAFDLFTALAGIQVNAARGHVALVANDCGMNTVAGVSFAASTADAGTTRTYTRNNIPATMETQTDAAGGGGFINLPVGEASFTATRAMDMRALGTITLPVRAGTVTSSLFPPVP